jgi:hypothetical protein
MKLYKSWVKTLCSAGAALFLFGSSFNANATIALFAATHTVDTVTPLAGGNWQYQYQLFNDSNTSIGYVPSGITENLNSWDLPWFALGGISLASITSPTGWSYSIETVGAPNLGTNWGGAWDIYATLNPPFDAVTQVLHWYATTGASAIVAQSSLSGFGYTAAYGPTYAPYQAAVDIFNYSDTSTFIVTADPAYPNSPDVFGTNATVPEPGVMALLLVGLTSLAFVRRKKTL